MQTVVSVIAVMLMASLGASVGAQTRPVISELMAANRQTLVDEDGHASDWLEVHNPANAPVDLAGWHLTDDAAEPQKWRFPAPTLVPAGGFQVVFCSGKNRVSGNNLHTDFKLASTGEYLALTDPSGAIVAQFNRFPRQFTDVSYGFEFDPGLTARLSYLERATPGAGNGLGSVVVEQVDHAPTILRPTQDCVVTARIHNPRNLAVDGCLLYRRVGFGPERARSMRDDGRAPDRRAADGVWTGVIPGAQLRAGAMLRWRVEVALPRGGGTRAPLFLAKTDSPEYFGSMVEDSAVRTAIPVWSWWTANPSAAETRAGTRCAVYYRGEFYDNVFVRSRGGSSLTFPKLSFKFDFNKGHHLRLDPLGGRVEEININSTWADKAYIRQNLSFEILRDIGVAASHAFAVRQQRNGSFYMVSILVEQVDSDFLAERGLDPDGALYKMYNVLNSAAPSSVHKRNRRHENWDDLETLVRSLGLPAAARERFVWDNVDVSACINYWCGITLLQDADAVQKNYYLHRASDGDGEWRMLPWDKDMVLGRIFDRRLLNDTIVADIDPRSHPLAGSKAVNIGPYNRLTEALLSVPRIRAMYLRRLRTVIDSILDDPSVPPSRRGLDQRLAVLKVRLDPDVALDRAKWGIPSYGDPTLDFGRALQGLRQQYLDRRRVHFFRTHGSGPNALIPPPQSAFGLRLGFGRIVVAPTSGNKAEQFVELANSGTAAVDLSGWRIQGAGIEFELPAGCVLTAGTAVYVAADPAAFRQRRVSPRGGENRFVVGPFRGRLSSARHLVLYNHVGMPVTSTGEFPYRLSGSGRGDLQLTVSGAAPGRQLWILFSGDNSGVPGSGPFLGLGLDCLPQVGLALGTAPFHVRADASGRYSFAAPPGTLPIGTTLTSRAIYLDPRARIVVSDVQRVKF